MKGKLFLFNWAILPAKPLIQALRISGWDVDIEHEDGRRATERISRTPPTAVLIDLSRQPANGYVTAAALRRAPTCHDLPIIFVGGEPAAIEQALAHVPDAQATTIPTLGALLATLIPAAEP